MHQDSAGSAAILIPVIAAGLLGLSVILMRRRDEHPNHGDDGALIGPSLLIPDAQPVIGFHLGS